MKKTFNIISAVIKAFLTFIGFLILSLPIAISGSVISLVIAILVLTAGFFVSLYVYKVIRRRGSMLSYNFATPDLDNLIPVPGSGVNILSTEKLITNFVKKKNLMNKGIISIWGDWNEKNLDKENTITNINYTATEHRLIITFKTGSKVTIIKPKHIFETSSYLKVVNASKILWEWDKVNAMTYEYTKNGIKTHTNSDWQIDSLDTDLTQPAFIIKNY